MNFMEVNMSKYIIVGGVAGGASTAARLRRLDEHAEIIIFERGEYISYANCGLPYYIGGKISERENLFVQTPESFNQRFRIDVRIKTEAIKINREKKSVEVKELETDRVYEETYDKLVLSPGAYPVRPNLPGIHEKGIFTLRNVPDTDEIKTYMDEKKPKRAVIVGAGFIGLEMAENLHRRGIFVTIVEMEEQVMTPLDYEMAAEVHQHLKIKHVEFYLKDAVAGFEKKDDHLIVKLSSGRALESDLVILSIGVRPESQLADEAGLTIGENGGIIVNDYLQTSDPDIYAIGDAVESENPIINKKMLTYLAGPANKQGRIAADNIVHGYQRKYSGTIGTAIAKVFDLTVASTGVSEKTLKRLNIPYISSVTHNPCHAGYYPDANPLSLKIVFSPADGKLFGAQIVGYCGVDKRIDMIASVLKSGGTVFDLQDIEHAYAPPFSSAKDPVNMAGFVGENILNGLVQIVHWEDLCEQSRTCEEPELLIDVRSPAEYALGTIEDAVNIPLDDLRERLDEIPADKRLIIFCAVGLRGYLACRILMQNGFKNVYNLSGGYKTYQFATQKQSNEDIFEGDYIGKDGSIYQTKPE
jgi:NADPH-dependent 2,4-dienoyl-CoA reductase/sulfur reductase-like enzyme/rhodanese-related sulfurtransferase